MKRSIQTSMSLWAFKRRPWTSMTLQSQNRVAGLALDDSQAKPMETETNIYIYIIFDFVSGDVEGQISNAAEGQLFSIISQMILKTQVKRLRIYTVTEIRLLQMKYQCEFVPKKTTKTTKPTKHLIHLILGPPFCSFNRLSLDPHSTCYHARLKLGSWLCPDGPNC